MSHLNTWLVRHKDFLGWFPSARSFFEGPCNWLTWSPLFGLISKCQVVDWRLCGSITWIPFFGMISKCQVDDGRTLWLNNLDSTFWVDYVSARSLIEGPCGWITWTPLFALISKCQVVDWRPLWLDHLDSSSWVDFQGPSNVLKPSGAVLLELTWWINFAFLLDS